ncbi:MAG: M48 family metallopeptidase [Pseudomonadota bacterium]
MLLRLHSERGLEIVSPRPLGARQARELLERHREWIENQLVRHPAWPRERLPEHIDLTALGQRWDILHTTRSGPPGLDACPITRRMTARGASETLWPLIGEWLHTQARTHLLATIHELSAQHGLPLRGATVRWARTRWGSCSSRGTVSLSARLLWLTPEQVHYVMMHELTHLEHLHHGPAFWRALEARMPDARAVDRQLRHAAPSLPPWLALLK